MNTEILFAAILAAVSGEGLVRQLMHMLVIGVCVLLIWAAGRYIIKKFAGPDGPSPHVLSGWNVIFVLLGLFVVINVLLSLIGYPLIKW